MPETAWRDFEKLLAEIHRKAAPGAVVSHDRRVIGRSGRRRQLDITISQDVAFYPTLIVVECKRYRRSVSIDKMEAFAAKLEDVGASHGVMVTHTGFDAGAKAVAAGKGITLLSYRQATDLDWNQATRSAAWLAFIATGIEPTHIEVEIEEDEHVEVGLNTPIHDESGSPATTLDQLAFRLVRETPLGQRPGEYVLECTPDTQLFVSLTQGLRRIKELRITCRVRAFEYVINLSLGAGHVLTDSITGETRYEELTSKPWDCRELLASQPRRELFTADFDQVTAKGRHLALVNPETMKRYMRVVISRRRDDPPINKDAG